jgi:thioredoxin reductase (NADPH)
MLIRLRNPCPDLPARCPEIGNRSSTNRGRRLLDGDLYIVLNGALETFWKDALDRGEHSITLRAGEFSGELNLLNQRETLIAARALSGSTLLRMPRERLCDFLTAEPTIGEIILKTIVQRRLWFVQSGAGGLVLLGAKWVLKSPDLRTLADKLGISENVREGITWDVLVVGAGPAGLATSRLSPSESHRLAVLSQGAFRRIANPSVSS